MLQITDTKKEFRKDINALRALAVVSVLLFHYKMPYCDGGFIGVDVFFVISGYLMSRIIFTAIDKGTFSIKDFYTKRLKRIVPALLVLILIITIACFFFYFPDDYRNNSRYAVSSLAFLSNVFYWQQSGYFDPSADNNILLHTWSLSVEWQFYLIYPVLLALFSKILHTKIQWLFFLSALSLILFAISVSVTKDHPTASFYLLPTRSWELLMGAIAFFCGGLIQRSFYRRILAMAGYISIVLCVLFMDKTLGWPGYFTAIPVLATFFVICSDYTEFWLANSSPTQILGRVSYSLYLWHWPVYVMAGYIGFQFSPVSGFILTAIVLMFAYLSYEFIEQAKASSQVILTSMTVLLISNVGLSYINSNESLFNPRALALVNYEKHHDNEIQEQMSYGYCFISAEHTGLRDLNKKRCLSIDENRKNILLIGDSHAAALSASLKESLDDKNINLIQATSSGCFPFIRSNGKPRCSEIMNYIHYDFIVKNASKIDGVIICGNWVGFASRNRTSLVDDLDNTLDYLKKYHLKALIIGQNETYSIPYSLIVAKEFEYRSILWDKYLIKDAYKVNALLNDKFKPYYINIINSMSVPELSVKDEPYMYDTNHFTKYGADLTTQKILTNPTFTKWLPKYVAKL